MRGPDSRPAIVALAFLLGAAGASSLGTPSPAGAAECLPELGGHAAPASSLARAGPPPAAAPAEAWRETNPERTGTSGKGEPRSWRHRHATELAGARRPAAERDEWARATGRATGLLGLLGSPANAPPGS